MAKMIICPSCKMGFSSASRACPHCRNPYIHCLECGSTNMKPTEEDPKQFRCEDCGATRGK